MKLTGNLGIRYKVTNAFVIITVIITIDLIVTVVAARPVTVPTGTVVVLPPLIGAVIRTGTVSPLVAAVEAVVVLGGANRGGTGQ